MSTISHDEVKKHDSTVEPETEMVEQYDSVVEEIKDVEEDSRQSIAVIE